MKRLPAWTAILLFTLALQGCGNDPMRPDPPSKVPADVRTFVMAEGLPKLQTIDLVFKSNEQTLLFRAAYGTLHDCPSSCFYSSATGLKLQDKLGWVRFDDHEGLDLDQVNHFDVTEADVALFDTAFWTNLEHADSRTLWAALLPMLAADTDTPATVLLEIALRLHGYISGNIVWKLLDNPNVRESRDILEVLANLPEFAGDPYGSARQRALELLDEFHARDVPGCTWMAMEPIQCLLNPWEQDWLEKHGNDYNSYPRRWERQRKIIREYYGGQDIGIHNITTRHKYDEVCEACACPAGYTLYLYVEDEDVRTMLDRGFRVEGPEETDQPGLN